MDTQSKFDEFSLDSRELVVEHRINKNRDNNDSDIPSINLHSLSEVFNIRDFDSNSHNAVKSVDRCHKPNCDDADMECVTNLVNATICEAVEILESDPRGLFCYKYPQMRKLSSTSIQSNTLEVLMANVAAPQKKVTAAMFSVYSTELQSQITNVANVSYWLTIEDFSYAEVVSKIRSYIGQWQLSPDTKCVVLTNPKIHKVERKGTIYNVDAHFSRPTPQCPNPLAVAKVRFIVTVSDVLVPHYPVMITYRFEGYSVLYYAVGERSLNSLTFQRFFIDTILHTKLMFYAQICECRHGTIDNPKVNYKSKEPKQNSSAP